MPHADPDRRRAYQRLWQRRSMKAKSDRWRDAGGCTTCGTPVATFKRCLTCRAQRAAWHAARVAAKPARYCSVHPTVRIGTGCRRCAAQRVIAIRWRLAVGELRARVRAHLLRGWSSIPETARATRISRQHARRLVYSFRRPAQGGPRAEVQIRGRMGPRRVRLFKLVAIDTTRQVAA